MLAWSDRFATNIASIDAQHRRLFDLLNQFSDCFTKGGPREEAINYALSELVDYTNKHFKDEEDFMISNKIDPRHLATQRMEHNSFIYDVKNMSNGLFDEDGVMEQSEKLVRFITLWLTYHILGTDMDMAAQLRSIVGGLSPEKAYDLEHSKKRDNLTTRLMLDAVLGMWREAMEKNRKLEEELAALKYPKV
jgi:hemerythrin